MLKKDTHCKTTTVREQLADPNRSLDVSVHEEVRQPGVFSLHLASYPKDPEQPGKYFVLNNEMREVNIYERMNETDDIILTREMCQDLYDNLTDAGFTSTKVKETNNAVEDIDPRTAPDDDETRI